MFNVNIPKKGIYNTIAGRVEELVEEVGLEVERRVFKASNELTNATALVFRGNKSGRIYTLPGSSGKKYNKKTKKYTFTRKTYRASAPGETPAIRTGVFRAAWKRGHFIDGREGFKRIVHATTENKINVNGYNLGQILEEGTERMAKRPYKQKVIDIAKPGIMKIYSKPYSPQIKGGK